MTELDDFYVLVLREFINAHQDAFVAHCEGWGDGEALASDISVILGEDE